MNIKRLQSLAVLVLMLGTLSVQAASVIQLEIESSKNGEPAARNTNIITIDDNKVRLDYPGAETQKTATTPYLLTLNAGEDWILANTKDNKFYCAKVDMNEFFRELGDIMWNMDNLTNPKFSDMKVELLVEEPGPEVLGYATTHLRFQTTARIKATVVFKKYEYGMVKTDDIWYAKDREIHPAKKRWIEALTHSGYEPIDQLSSELRSKIPGSILKQDSVVKTTDYKKDKVDSYEQKVRVISVKEVKSSEVAAGTFNKPDCKKISKSQTKDAAKALFTEGKFTL